MIRKLPSSKPGYLCVTFELPACLWADRVSVVGEFNHWDKQSLPMSQNHNGTWRLELELPVGRSYEFRYHVDGRWLTDSHADGLTTNL